MQKEKEKMSNVTREELSKLEERVNDKYSRLDNKVSDICKGQTKTMETVFEIKSTTKILENTINTLKDSFEKYSVENSTRLAEQKDAIIKEITLIFLQEQGTKLFKTKLQTIIGGGLLCSLGAIVIYLGNGIITKIVQAL